MEEKREPDKILEAEQENSQKGKLKIYFGYSRGVGKTYAMLQFARLKKLEGIDIVVGCVNTHGQAEVSDMLKELEQLQVITTARDHAFYELNLDAALKRNPQIILIDDMAHINTPKSRHRNRYEDINELLNAGIDVHTTLNVQHIESIQDMADKILGRVIQERIPDSELDKAFQMEMIDFSPRELISRIKKKNLYQNDTSTDEKIPMLDLDNLILLRKVAMQRMSEWINNENNENPLEHIMVCLSASPANEKVIYQAARMAKVFQAKFTAFYVEKPDYIQKSLEESDILRNNKKLAERLGAKTIVSYGSDVNEQIAEYAKAAKVTKVIMGRKYYRCPLFFFNNSFPQKLTRINPDLEIYTIPESCFQKVEKNQVKDHDRNKRIVLELLIGLSIIGLSTFAGHAFERIGFEAANLIMLYIFGAILFAMNTSHKISGLLYGIISIISFNFFFIDPKYTFIINDPGNVLTFFVMFMASILITTLMNRIKLSANQTTQKAFRMEILLETSHCLQKANHQQDIANTTVNQLGKLLNCNIYCFIGNPENWEEPFAYFVSEKKKKLSEKEIIVAVWSYRNNCNAGAFTTTMPDSEYSYLAVRNDDKIFAVVGIEAKEGGIPIFERSIVSSILNESALAFEKEEMLMKEQKMAIRLEEEHLRANLLRSISHDLRTPLTSISGNADMLLTESKVMNTQQRQHVYSDIYEDSVWLINLVENLLAITKIEEGTVQLSMKPELAEDVLAECMEHIHPKAVEHVLTFMQNDEYLIAKMDARLIMQVIINLIDNAIKYTQKGSLIEIVISKVKDNVVFEVKDNGDGVPSEHKDKIFTMFYTLKNEVADGRRGLGLGLSLCKSIVEAHGGKIWLIDNMPKGSVFGFSLKAEEVLLK